MPIRLTDEARVPASHLAQIPFYARLNRSRLSPERAPSKARDWSPERVLDAELRWQRGDHGQYASRGHAEYQRRNEVRADAERAAVERKPSPPFDKALAVAHIQSLHDNAGMGWEEIRLAGGIAKDTWRRALDPKVTKMMAETGERILAIKAPNRLPIAS